MTGMPERESFGDLLARRPEFDFDLVEHIETLGAMPQAARLALAFEASFGAPAPIDAQWRRARQALEDMTRNVPAYREIDWSADGFQDAIPLVSKADLRQRPDDFRPLGSEEKVWIRETTGTSGQPVRIFTSALYCAVHGYTATRKAMYMAGLDKAHLLARSVELLSLNERRDIARRAWTAPDGSGGACLQQLFDERIEGAVEAVAAEIEALSPAVLGVKPNILDVVASGWARARPNLRADIGLVMCSGAALSDALRKRAEEALGAPVVDAYGLSEIGTIAFSCPAHQGLHLDETAAIAEILRPDGSVAGAGTGALVLTGLTNGAMPLLRYLTGDDGTIVEGRCACGREGRRILSLDGRRLENFVLPGGRVCSPSGADRLFGRFPLREFRLTQTAPDRGLLEVEWLPGRNGEEMSRRAALAAEAVFEGALRIEVREAVFPPGDKFQRYRPYTG